MSTRQMIWIILCFASWSWLTTAFAPTLPSRRSPHSPSRINSSIPHLSVTSIVVAEVQSWRQYVPLAVSCFVILDIVLGSPAANSVMGLMRPPENNEQDDAEEGMPRRVKRRSQASSKERIDSMAVAQAAIDKANATLELKRFLEDKKTDWDKMEEIRKKMDRQMEELDEKIMERREKE